MNQERDNVKEVICDTSAGTSGGVNGAVGGNDLTERLFRSLPSEERRLEHSTNNNAIDSASFHVDNIVSILAREDDTAAFPVTLQNYQPQLANVYRQVTDLIEHAENFVYQIIPSFFQKLQLLYLLT